MQSGSKTLENFGQFYRHFDNAAHLDALVSLVILSLLGLGHVPETFHRLFPNASVSTLSWGGFNASYSP